MFFSLKNIKLWYTYWSITAAISKFKPQSYVCTIKKDHAFINHVPPLKSYFKLVFGLKTYFCSSTLGGETRNCSWNRISNKICMVAIHLAQVKYSLNTRFFYQFFDWHKMWPAFEIKNVCFLRPVFLDIGVGKIFRCCCT